MKKANDFKFATPSSRARDAPRTAPTRQTSLRVVRAPQTTSTTYTQQSTSGTCTPRSTSATRTPRTTSAGHTPRCRSATRTTQPSSSNTPLTGAGHHVVSCTNLRSRYRRSLSSDDALSNQDASGSSTPNKMTKTASSTNVAKKLIRCASSAFLWSASPRTNSDNMHQSARKRSPTPTRTALRKLPPVSPALSRKNIVGMQSKSPTVVRDIKGDEQSTIIVGVRVRPALIKELENPNVGMVVKMDEREVLVTPPCMSTKYVFKYDHCFWSVDREHELYSDQEQVYRGMAEPLLQAVLDGCNACLLAYGQTGSGKSYSILGDVSHNNINANTGIIPRFCHQLFSRLEDKTDCGKAKFIDPSVQVSIFEIYNEKIHDLLIDERGLKKPLKVREHQDFGPYVVDLTSPEVTSFDDIQSWLKISNRQRAIATTGMNERSSRSHCIFTLTVNVSVANFDGRVVSRKSHINLVDLAGSERASHAQTDHDRLKEGNSINRSLMTLGKVITALTQISGKTMHVPYRESALTWLLRESLGGNSKTAMLATISPCNIHMKETLSTLRYASQARNIINIVRVNEDHSSQVYRGLQVEIDRLKAMQETHALTSSVHRSPMNSTIIIEKNAEIQNLKQQIDDLQCQLSEAETKMLKRKRDSEYQKALVNSAFQQNGLMLMYDQSRPCLTNLVEDPLLSDVLLYQLPEGLTSIGNCPSDSQFSIVLPGSIISACHCTIENDGRALILEPVNGKTYLNGGSVRNGERLHLYHGDRLVLEGQHYFRVNNPYDQTKRNIHLLDFEGAKKEIIRCHEDQLWCQLRSTSKRDSFTGLNLSDPVEIPDYKSDFLNIINDMANSRNEDNNNVDAAMEIPGWHGKRMSLYELNCLVREANLLCSKMPNPWILTIIEASKESTNMPEVAIRVHDETNRIFTVWDMTKFLARLEQLREIDDPVAEQLNFSDDLWFSDKSVDSVYETNKLQEIIERSIIHLQKIVTSMSNPIPSVVVTSPSQKSDDIFGTVVCLSQCVKKLGAITGVSCCDDGTYDLSASDKQPTVSSQANSSIKEGTQTDEFRIATPDISPIAKDTRK